jgi:RsiW-degrading membrane proteinase PrsW (M82 family)
LLVALLGLYFVTMNGGRECLAFGILSMLRRLFNFASIVCFASCMALMVMWVRSYYYTDGINTRLGPYHGFEVRSTPGILYFEQFALASASVWPATVTSADNDGLRALDYLRLNYLKLNSMSRMGFAGSFSWPRQKWMLPYWFLVLASGLLAIGLRTQSPPWRFSLRTFLITTMFLAVVLGMMSWLDRSWLGQADVLGKTPRNVIGRF